MPRQRLSIHIRHKEPEPYEVMWVAWYLCLCVCVSGAILPGNDKESITTWINKSLNTSLISAKNQFKKSST